MYDDENGMGIIRAGRAAQGLKKRHNGHVTASIHQTTTTNLFSRFYSAYPDQGKGTSGSTFQDLRQVTGVRFKISMKTQVVDILSWDERGLKKLEQSKFQ